MGICPPSKPAKFMLPVRAFWPLPPRPAVLPWPLACPRPTRFFSFTPPPAGGVNLVSSFISHLHAGFRPARSAVTAYTLVHILTSTAKPRSTRSFVFEKTFAPFAASRWKSLLLLSLGCCLCCGCLLLLLHRP